jgi:putative hydrolase of HD superfamily
MEGSMDRDRLTHQMAFIVEIGRLKHVLRRTVTIHSDRNENDAEHSWHLAVMALLLSEHAGDGLDVFRAVKMVLVHDIVEIDAGDTYCYAEFDQAKKLEREQAAADRIFPLLPEDQAREVMRLWHEFEERTTPEARFAAALDRLEPLLLNYYTRGKTWQKYGVRRHQVVERAAPIGESSQALWDFARDLIDRAVSEGILSG